MKNIKLAFLLLFSLVALVSCTKEKEDLLTGDAKTGGLISVNSSLVSYAVGNGNDYKYAASFGVFQGAIKTTQVEIYKVFNSGAVKSNEILLKTIDVPASPQSQTLNFDVTYNELIAGLTIDGNELPTSDALLSIGDAWTLKYVAKTSNGDSHLNAQTTKVAVGTRFAGTYKVIKGEYWRINVYRPDVAWVGQTRVVESVNSTTYKFINFVGPFEAVTNTHYFTIDASDVVRTPTTYEGIAQIFNNFPATNCEENAATMTNACGFAGLQNTVFRDNVTGKDLIYRTYGYLSPSGPREIYEVLEKIVD